MTSHRVLMLAYPFPPAVCAGVFRSMRFAKYLPEFGWEPLVITPADADYYPGQRDYSLEASIPPGTLVRRTRVFRPFLRAEMALGRLRTRLRGDKRPPPEGDAPEAARQPTVAPAATPRPGLRPRIRQAMEVLLATPDRNVGWMLPAITAALGMVRQYRPEAIFSTAPPHSANLAAVILKSITGIPLVLDFRDPWSRQPWDPADRRPVRDRMAGCLERFCIRRADRVILNTPRMREDFVAAYPEIPPERFLVLPNGYDPDMLRDLGNLATPNGRGRAGSPLRICHAGVVYGKRDLRPLAGALGLLRQSGHDVRLEQIGSMDRRDEVESYLRRQGLQSHVALLPQLPHSEVLQHMAAADILAVIQPGTSIQVPGKLFELLMFRKPILALTGQGDTADIVRDYGVGVVADPGDPQAIAAAILQGAAAPADRAPSGWDRALEAFDGRRLTGELAGILNSVC